MSATAAIRKTRPIGMPTFSPNCWDLDLPVVWFEDVAFPVRMTIRLGKRSAEPLLRRERDRLAVVFPWSQAPCMVM